MNDFSMPVPTPTKQNSRPPPSFRAEEVTRVTLCHGVGGQMPHSSQLTLIINEELTLRNEYANQKQNTKVLNYENTKITLIVTKQIKLQTKVYLFTKIKLKT